MTSGGAREDRKDEEDRCDEMELSAAHLRMIAARHYWLPGSGVTSPPSLWYPYLPSYYGPQTAATYTAGGYKLIPDSAAAHCYIIPAGQLHHILLLNDAQLTSYLPHSYSI